jgi:formylglycine-generating enzyme
MRYKLAPVRHCFALSLVLIPLSVVLSAATGWREGEGTAQAKAPCPPEMAYVDESVCVDRYEGALFEVEGGARHSPYVNPGTKEVKAVSKRGLVPQAYISKVEAENACKASNKRLCKEQEWVKACQGRTPTRYPYGEEHKEGYCNDSGKAPLPIYYHDSEAAYASAEALNDARLNQVPGTVARTGRFRKCRNAYGIHDMVGNVHEWVDDPEGTFRGGYYLDTVKNGEGCKYRTSAHDASYHDYSTGFRCCKDPR